MATREIAKRGMAAAADKWLRDAMPSPQIALAGVERRLDDIGQQIFKLDAKVDNLRHEMYDKFEQTRETINQLGQRISHLEGKVEQATKSLDRQGQRLENQSDKIEHWIERVVKLEGTRRGRVTSR